MSSLLIREVLVLDGQMERAEKRDVLVQDNIRYFPANLRRLLYPAS
ncbi:MAG TPA: hypothetical protein PLV56_01535 [Synergistales bacterium]|nr:hypothetical protein [Synergistales bacterium]